MSFEHPTGALTKQLSRRSIFSSADRSDVRSYFNSSKCSEMPEELRRLKKLKYETVCLSEPTTEEEVVGGNESHVDSEDSGLFKEGYFLKRSSSRLKKSQVDKEVSKWKSAAEQNLEDLTSNYGSKANVSFSIPLGLEMNRRVAEDPPADESTLSSKISSMVDTEDEMEVARNDEFMKEVQRVLRKKRNPETLTKRNLQEEYKRQLSKKMRAVCEWAQNTYGRTGKEQKALPVSENASNTDTVAGGDNTSGGPAKDIFDQLSQMVLKNKISKRSKAAQARKEIFKRAEEKRENLGEQSKFSDVDEELMKPQIEEDKLRTKRVRFFDECDETDCGMRQTNLTLKPPELEYEVTHDDNAVAIAPGMNISRNARMEKVENYLSSHQDSYSSGDDDWSDNILSPEEQSYVFDGLVGEFLKSERSQSEQGRITRNDKRLLTFLVRRFVERKELDKIDEMLKESLEDCRMKIPPGENVEDRELYFMKMLIRKYIKRGMRTILEDKIAWIYYKTEESKKRAEKSLKSYEQSQGRSDIQKLVEAFESSGGNSSLNRLVEELLQEHVHGTASEEEKAQARIEIRKTIVTRFAQVFLERSSTTFKNDCEAKGAKEVVTEINDELKVGVEHFYMNGSPFKIKWRVPGVSHESSNTDAISTDGLVDECNAHTHKKREEEQFRLKDRFWSKQQEFARQVSRKQRRYCTPLLKRGISLIGATKTSIKLNQKPGIDELKKRLRKENIRWLTEQKNKLWEARNKKAKSIDEFTMSLPRRMEQIIKKRDRIREELIEQETSKSKPTRYKKFTM